MAVVEVPKVEVESVGLKPFHEFDEANQTCAAGAQVAAVIAERGWEDLDGPVVRVATPDVPIPFSPPLEQALLPSVDRVREACRELLEY